MKILKQTLFTLIAVAGLSLAASAQKNDPKPRPPKEKPPVVTPGEKKPPKNEPKGGNRPQKPGMSWMFALNRSDENLA